MDKFLVEKFLIILKIKIKWKQIKYKCYKKIFWLLVIFLNILFFIKNNKLEKIEEFKTNFQKMKDKY